MDRKTRKFLTDPLILAIFTLGFTSLSPLFAQVDSPSRVPSHTYTKADLEILQEGKNYQEFFAHAKDIIPTKRDKSWYDMLSNMAANYIDNLKERSPLSLEDYEKVEKLSRWPELKRDEFFQVKRNSFATQFFRDCFLKVSPKTICRDKMLTYWGSSNKEAETGFQLLTLYHGFYPQKSGKAFLKTIVNSEVSNFYCQRPLIQNLFQKYLQEEFPRPEKINELELNNMANSKCWKQVAESLEKSLYELPPNEGKTFFYVLDKRSRLSTFDRDLWLTRYFLSSPNPGSLLNQSWNTLKNLSQNYERRMKVLKTLRTFDPLPGELFQKGSPKTRQAFIRHLSENFPEYLNHYAKTCLSYLEGSRVFPRGNPTMECHDLFVTTKKMDKIISQPLSLKYSAVKKLD